MLLSEFWDMNIPERVPSHVSKAKFPFLSYQVFSSGFYKRDFSISGIYLLACYIVWVTLKAFVWSLEMHFGSRKCYWGKTFKNCFQFSKWQRNLLRHESKLLLLSSSWNHQLPIRLKLSRHSEIIHEENRDTLLLILRVVRGWPQGWRGPLLHWLPAMSEDRLSPPQQNPVEGRSDHYQMGGNWDTNYRAFVSCSAVMLPQKKKFFFLGDYV